MVAQPTIALRSAAMHKDHAFQASSPKNFSGRSHDRPFFCLGGLGTARNRALPPLPLLSRGGKAIWPTVRPAPSLATMRPLSPQHGGTKTLAKTSPLEFIRQVRTETSKVTWPTRRETVMTGVMVVIMTTILALFFFAVDSILQAIVTALLKLAQ
jgi:preprotein translocase subunit SecE